MLRLYSQLNKKSVLKSMCTNVSIQNDYLYVKNSGTLLSGLKSMMNFHDSKFYGATGIYLQSSVKRGFCKKNTTTLTDSEGFKEENLSTPPTSLNSNGSNYLGTYNKDGLYHGNGELHLEDGSLYRGQFLDGRKNGKGMHIYKDGSKFIGEFVDDSAEGQGELILVNL